MGEIGLETGFFGAFSRDFSGSATGGAPACGGTMKLTVKLDYACRALAQLAKRYERGEVSSIDELAGVEKVPAKYLAQILGELRNGGLVESRRGKQGGYLLARQPSDITLRDAIAVIEGDWFAAASGSEGESGGAVASAWNALRSDLESSARAVTLADLASRETSAMYYI